MSFNKSKQLLGGGFIFLQLQQLKNTFKRFFARQWNQTSQMQVARQQDQIRQRQRQAIRWQLLQQNTQLLERLLKKIKSSDQIVLQLVYVLSLIFNNINGKSKSLIEEQSQVIARNITKYSHNLEQIRESCQWVKENIFLINKHCTFVTQNSFQKMKIKIAFAQLNTNQQQSIYFKCFYMPSKDAYKSYEDENMEQEQVFIIQQQMKIQNYKKSQQLKQQKMDSQKEKVIKQKTSEYIKKVQTYINNIQLYYSQNKVQFCINPDYLRTTRVMNFAFSVKEHAPINNFTEEKPKQVYYLKKQDIYSESKEKRIVYHFQTARERKNDKDQLIWREVSTGWFATKTKDHRYIWRINSAIGLENLEKLLYFILRQRSQNDRQQCPSIVINCGSSEIHGKNIADTGNRRLLRVSQSLSYIAKINQIIQNKSNSKYNFSKIKLTKNNAHKKIYVNTLSTVQGCIYPQNADHIIDAFSFGTKQSIQSKRVHPVKGYLEQDYTLLLYFSGYFLLDEKTQQTIKKYLY